MPRHVGNGIRCWLFWVPSRNEEASNADLGRSGLALFERSEFSQTPPESSSAAYRRSRATNSAVFSFGYFWCLRNFALRSEQTPHAKRAFGQAKKSRFAGFYKSASPAGAKPGLPELASVIGDTSSHQNKIFINHDVQDNASRSFFRELLFMGSSSPRYRRRGATRAFCDAAPARKRRAHPAHRGRF